MGTEHGGEEMSTETVQKKDQSAVPAPVVGQNSRRSRQPLPGWDLRTWLVAVPLILIVIAAFIPALDNGFVNWDDDKNFLENPYYRGLGGAQWKWAWSTFWLGVYQPLAWLLFEVQYVSWKLHPRGYHLTSVILHATNAVVLYVLAVTLLVRSRPDLLLKSPWACSLGAGLATALFAVHPLRVEAVAWASCQPYLPCALFSMLAVLAYLRGFGMGTSPEWGWLVGSFVLFVAALLSHALAVSLPVVLVILDVYLLRRFDEGRGRWFAPAARKIWYEKVPFVIVSFVFMGVAIAARRQSLASVERNDPSASLAQACYGIVFYIHKTFLPLDLIAVYPAARKIDWLAPPFVHSILGTLAVSVGVFLVRRHWPGLLAAWLSYLMILAPNSGIIRINDQFAGDRYSYLSTAGLVIVLAGCFCRFWQTTGRVRKAALGVIALGVGLLLFLIPMTWNQCRTWRNSETLWTHALNHGAAESSLAHYNLALVQYRQGNLEAAAAHYAEALRLNPGDFVVYNNLGVVLQHQGKLELAAARYTDALRLDPNYLDAHFNLGIVLSRQGKFEAAAGHYAHTLRLNPGFADAHHNLGVDFFRQGKLAEAEAHYAEALRLNPGRVDTHTNLGVVLSRRGKLDQAAAHYAQALRLNPGYDDARKNLEVDRARQRKVEEAANR
jgi:protein O-mannosyl-transferase